MCIHARGDDDYNNGNAKIASKNVRSFSRCDLCITFLTAGMLVWGCSELIFSSDVQWLESDLQKYLPTIDCVSYLISILSIHMSGTREVKTAVRPNSTKIVFFSSVINEKEDLMKKQK